MPYLCICLHSDHKAGIFIPVQQRALSRFGLRILDIRPAIHEPLMRHDLCELAGDGAVHVFHDLEVGWEEDVEVALLDLQYVS